MTKEQWILLQMQRLEEVGLSASYQDLVEAYKQRNKTREQDESRELVLV